MRIHHWGLRTGLFLLVLSSSCSFNTEVRRWSDLPAKSEGQPLRILTVDSADYSFREFTVQDSGIAGKGYIVKQWKPVPFEGFIPFTRIGYLFLPKPHVIKTLLLPIAMIGLTIPVVSSMETEQGLRMWETKGGSCPYVSVWNGSRYVLEAESFGTALGRGMETATLSVLPSLHSDHGSLRIRITNERPETHFLNSLEVLAIPAPDGTAVVADAAGTPWSVRSPQSPAIAVDDHGNDAVAALANPDGSYWRSAGNDDWTQFTDEIELGFLNPAGISDGSLIIRAVNTQITEAVFSAMLGALGEESLEFVRAVDTDPEMIASMKEWLRESSLKVFVWNGTEWKEQGIVLPEATETSFTRLVRIHAEDITSDIVKVRLAGMKDVWQIDAVQADWTPSQPLQMFPLIVRTVQRPDGRDERELTALADRRYALLVPGDTLNAVFDAPPASQQRYSYAVRASGYLYEWMMPTTQKSVSAFAGMFPPRQKVEYLKHLLRQREVFLEPVYVLWEKLKRDP